MQIRISTYRNNFEKNDHTDFRFIPSDSPFFWLVGNQIVTSFNEANKKVQRENTEDKSRSRVREWLQAAGEGFQCLRADKQDQSEMQWLEGNVIGSSTEKTQLISWKVIHVFLILKHVAKPFKDGEHVKFTVGFSLRGVRAITVISATPDSAIV